jgi:hypothetical protein
MKGAISNVDAFNNTAHGLVKSCLSPVEGQQLLASSRQHSRVLNFLFQSGAWPPLSVLFFFLISNNDQASAASFPSPCTEWIDVVHGQPVTRLGSVILIDDALI